MRKHQSLHFIHKLGNVQPICLQTVQMPTVYIIAYTVK